MIKKIIKYLLYLLIIIFFSILYLSYFGIETKRFNEIIKNKIKEANEEINIELKEVKVNLNIIDFAVKVKTEDTNVNIKDKNIKIEKISTNFSINSFLRKEFAIKNIQIRTKQNSLKDIVKIFKTYQNTPQIFIFSKMIKEGFLQVDLNLKFNEKGELLNNYIIKGKIKEGKLKLFNKEKIENIKFEFNIRENLYLIENGQIEYDKLKLSSKKIKIKKNTKNKNYLLSGDIENSESLVSNELATVFFKKLKNFNDLIFSSKSNFTFEINKKFKVSNLKLKSNINLKKIIFNKKNNILKKHIKNYNDLIELKNHKITLEINKNKILIDGKGNFEINDTVDNIDYQLISSNKDYKFKSKIELYNLPIKFKSLNYSKKEKSKAMLILDGIYKKSKKIHFQNISFNEANNTFKIKNLHLSEDSKIKSIDEIIIDFKNLDKRENKIFLKKDKKNYILKGKIFDATNLINRTLENDKEGNTFAFLKEFDSNIKIDIEKLFIENESYINNLLGNLNFKNSILYNLDLDATFPNNQKISFTIKTDENNEKITTLYSDQARPLVKKYKFIKGFDGGSLDFYSVKKNNVSKSQLKIYNFKLNELPALTKVLTLASLQGIADLLTGEGIRFNEFEMNFTNESSTMTIDEIYAIGPAISILMDGYVAKDKTISLRGTLVPATTLNKVIGSIPFLGNILVGKKTGEGVFGVSFKIKGLPKNLKTTVNPIKTLTPRFITRTLEKIKEN